MSTDNVGFELPDGTALRVLATDTEPDQLMMELRIPSRGLRPPKHFHPNQVDDIEIVSGRLELFADGKWHELAAGDRFTVEPGQIHTYQNPFNEPAILRSRHAPVDSFGCYLHELALLAESGKLRLRHPMTLIYLASVLVRHDDCLRLADPLSRIAVKALAVVADQVGPSRARRVARFNRQVTNRLVGRWAGSLPPWAVVVHRGRKSGKSYRTPVLARVADGRVLIAVLYGARTDWLRNIAAAGGGELIRSGKRYRLESPAVLDRRDRDTLPPVSRQLFRWFANVFAADLRPIHNGVTTIGRDAH
ncbi:nitroreductase family deazaflavin-dependent oxidoreductase [Nocardia arthritidis]|uniref:Nitroreductase family deazaflavin-dependent oxidoreductase n=1 Tax=Nocardia arthritidis TaxID=228602 RepID=A0A6G9YLG7_9NOCA|nr:nitroreductase family deazaflavin-dependent oxidoreductase [Nocardia arthritidis]QIS14119.1 nitroreductase family deazaflavin-dependent oxidoreductase [Nocardia arthritidis]